MNEIKSIHWKQLLGNPFVYALHPAMTTDKGYRLKTVSRCIGMSKSSEKIPMIVLFDREYVKASIKGFLFSKLQVSNYNELQKLIGESWKEWKDEAH